MAGRNLCRETDNGVEKKEALRNRVLALAGNGLFDFDSLEYARGGKVS
jgi:hypothetical protein